MKNISIKEARQNLRELITQVEHGEQITITRQGKAVAQLAPPPKIHKVLPPLAEFRQELGKAGTPAAKLLRAERAAK